MMWLRWWIPSTHGTQAAGGVAYPRPTRGGGRSGPRTRPAGRCPAAKPSATEPIEVTPVRGEISNSAVDATGEVTRENVALLQEADAIVTSEVEAAESRAFLAAMRETVADDVSLARPAAGVSPARPAARPGRPAGALHR